MCPKQALATRTKFKLEILIGSTISAIHKFRENILGSSRNVSETTLWAICQHSAISANNLMSSRRQAITWANNDRVYRLICVSPDLNELKPEVFGSSFSIPYVWLSCLIPRQKYFCFIMNILKTSLKVCHLCPLGNILWVIPTFIESHYKYMPLSVSQTKVMESFFHHSFQTIPLWNIIIVYITQSKCNGWLYVTKGIWEPIRRYSNNRYYFSELSFSLITLLFYPYFDTYVNFALFYLWLHVLLVTPMHKYCDRY